MKVVLLSRSFDVGAGDSFKHGGKLKEELLKLGVEVATIEGNPNSGRYGKFFYDFVIVPIKIIIKRLQGYKIFHAIWENQAIFLPWLAPRSITNFHDLSRYGKGGIDGKIFDFIYKQAAKCNRIICNSPQTSARLRELYNVPEEKIRIVFMAGNGKKLRRIKRKIFRVGYLGKLEERKRVELLLDAAEKLKGNKDIEFSIYGRGPKEEELKGFIRERNLTNVKMHGVVSESKITEAYNSLDLLFHPASWEGFGSTIIEAGQCGTHTMIMNDAKIPIEVSSHCTRAKSMKDVVQKILFFKQNPEKLRALAEKSYKHCKEFSWENTARETLNIYEELG